MERAVLGDFGFCKILSSNSELTSGAFGSPMYMAPEVIQGKSYGVASDLYSLGIVLYEMLMGNVPYDAANIDDLVSQIHGKGPNFKGKRISKKLETLILSLLEENPQMRITHTSLFEIVLKDPNYPNSIIDSDYQTSYQQTQPESNPANAVLDNFVKEILYERSKYTYLIDLAAQATYFKKYTVFTQV